MRHKGHIRSHYVAYCKGHVPKIRFFNTWPLHICRSAVPSASFYGFAAGRYGVPRQNGYHGTCKRMTTMIQKSPHASGENRVGSEASGRIDRAVVDRNTDYIDQTECYAYGYA